MNKESLHPEQLDQSPATQAFNRLLSFAESAGAGAPDPVRCERREAFFSCSRIVELPPDPEGEEAPRLTRFEVYYNEDDQRPEGIQAIILRQATDDEMTDVMLGWIGQLERAWAARNEAVRAARGKRDEATARHLESAPLSVTLGGPTFRDAEFRYVSPDSILAACRNCEDPGRLYVVAEPPLRVLASGVTASEIAAIDSLLKRMPAPEEDTAEPLSNAA